VPNIRSPASPLSFSRLSSAAVAMRVCWPRVRKGALRTRNSGYLIEIKRIHLQ
jgi:hypothetical protein